MITTTDYNQVLLTQEGLDALKKELEHLKTSKRKELAERLKEAISYGDLSENSEYEEAKNEQAFVEGRILELEKKVKNAKIISDKKHSKTSIQVGSTVTVINFKDKNKEKETYTIVGSTEADPTQNRISNESPVGVALIGKHKGDEIKIAVPSGNVEYKVVNFK